MRCTVALSQPTCGLLYLAEIRRDGLPTGLIGFTGGEPFMNPALPAMLDDVLSGGFSALVLTNAMKPMRRTEAALLDLNQRFGKRLTIRVSLDHYTAPVHEAERGARTWQPALDGLLWLVRNGFETHVAARLLSGEPAERVRQGFGRLFAERGIGIDALDPVRLILFPDMGSARDVPEITEACWGILGRSPDSVMCASSRMVIRRRGADAPSVAACTLLPYDPRFELGTTLAEAVGAVALNHRYCAEFCVLGGAACSRR
ncbi:radical SAM protein [Rhodopila globiformis]|uniref:radical SAM protein n=1 Tax=Rhodopila globiformis TaxID=1071 RepID=UPI00130494D8|nr:radical SAM protein [Rhodopila globiformis]